jgi:hypothetical protein
MYRRESRRKHTFSFNNASETGFPGRADDTGGGAIDVSGIFSSSHLAISLLPSILYSFRNSIDIPRDLLEQKM